MIANIVDRRTRQYRWKSVNAIIEATWHDNSCEDSDRAEEDRDGVTYDQRRAVSLKEAIDWAHAQPTEVTLFIYDDGAGF
jgi:hypothetical protein